MLLGVRANLFCVLLVMTAWVAVTLASPAAAQVTPFKQALATAAARDNAIADYYRETGYKPLWTGKGNRYRQRRNALLSAVSDAGAHGLPQRRYDPKEITARIKSARGAVELGELEVYLSSVFLAYARNVQTGVLTPSAVDPEIVREVPLRGRKATLAAFAKSSPGGFMKALPPKSAEYARLMKEKLRLERAIAKGGWGAAVPANTLKPGASGKAVVALRNRLIAMGYMGRSNTQTYDEAIRGAVQQFQLAHGLATDGIAGPGTMAEVNTSMEERLASVVVAMERERWNNRPLGKRHVWVNLTDFSAQIRDGGKVVFATRSVIGAAEEDRRSPEFSDVMEFMVINPSWYVPRSIATKEYLPLLKRNRNAVSHLEITDNKGRKINRGAVNFARYDEKTFPFSMREPPSQGNALGLVKFMFPNQYNIYLHDTPAKALFAKEVRAYSHGCIRLNDPFEFAYALLARQESNPEKFFQDILTTEEETRVNLKQALPVHIIYRTAFTSPKGNLNFRRDIYGRDAAIWDALTREGVVLRAIRG